MSDIPLFRPHTSPAARERVLEVLASGWLGYGPQCRLLEQRFIRERRGFSLATSSCTTALYLAALACRDEHEAPEAVVPAATFISTAMAFAHAGYRVRVADVDRATLTITAQTARRMLTGRTRALVVVHLYGQRAPDLPALRALADMHGIALIEDCAHRVDLDDEGPRLADFACFSFNAVKELPGGEAGLLWGRNAAIEPLVRSISNAGLAIDTLERSASTQHLDYRYADATGLKLRSSDIAAAMVLGALDEWPRARAARREQFDRYDAMLAPLARHVETMTRAPSDSFLMYVVRTRWRDMLRDGLAARGIATSVHYPSLARHPRFAADADPSARADSVDGTIVTLPTALHLSAQAQHRVARAIAETLGQDARAVDIAD